MAAVHPGTWARRIAIGFGIDLNKPGVEPDHYICTGFYCCTEQGFGESIRARNHVFYVSAFEYDQSIKSDKRAPAWESMIIGHIECTAEGLGIRCYGLLSLIIFRAAVGPLNRPISGPAKDSWCTGPASTITRNV